MQFQLKIYATKEATKYSVASFISYIHFLNLQIFRTLKSLSNNMDVPSGIWTLTVPLSHRVCLVSCISCSYIHTLLLCLTILKEVSSNLREECV